MFPERKNNKEGIRKKFSPRPLLAAMLFGLNYLFLLHQSKITYLKHTCYGN